MTVQRYGFRINEKKKEGKTNGSTISYNDHTLVQRIIKKRKKQIQYIICETKESLREKNKGQERRKWPRGGWRKSKKGINSTKDGSMGGEKSIEIHYSPF